ncbi:Zn(II)2Cys6 transcription factor [Aspergillus flavus]|uniref:Zn(II)2Cys6 transcription factor n=1 Tax=Aspergillus flavus (strain ATCC 200026 / FGSC A1120 / IAM 13836 / NRRL 3357 / JCM 12722 / SRRC 167) TaxID=332952 RepID=A0A7U2N1K4_ASPFN|nr:Zn(II)2Cys6 transcription factor [Aspergillus flavus]
MDNPNTVPRKLTTDGITTGPGTKRRRIRPSRARGLRTRTGWERRVKCDDGKPTCVRCSKSDRICRYAQVADERHATGAGARADYESPKVQSDSREARSQEALPSVGSAAYYRQVTYSGPTEHPDGSIETPQNDRLNEAGDQRLSSLDPCFSASPLSLSQISLLNISPFEWYDLLARDAISNIQRLNDASTGDSRWKFPEIVLSRRQSPAPECPEAHVEQSNRHSEQQQQIEPPLLNYQQVFEPWNTTSRIELSETDVKFFRYYIEVVGPILDLFDPARHFSNVVPHLALRNTGLLKSILAVGAKHMSLGHMHMPGEDVPGDHATPNVNAPNVNSPTSLAAATGLPSEPDPAPAHMATQYYYETLQYLSQTLLYPSYADSHEILATATMISTYEMFDADSATTSGDWEKHLRGSFWIQRSQDNDGESVDGLRQAVWWAWLRQDIWAAFRAGRPTLTFWRARKGLEELDADELATRIVYICGKCVAYAASSETSNHDPRHSIEQGDRLLYALDDWYRALPASYQPVTVATDTASNTTVFPPIWIHPPSHAGAMQMYNFARATVLLNQPTMGGLNAYCLRDKQLSECVKMVCGIAKACQDHESAMAFVNVQALFGVGQFVRSPEMRGELLRILEKMLRISKFPARGLVAELKKVWQE